MNYTLSCAVTPSYISPGMPRLPVIFPISSSVVLSAVSIASFTAAQTRSSNVSISSGSTTSGSIRIALTRCAPVTLAVTAPPPGRSFKHAFGEFLLLLLHFLLDLLHLLERAQARPARVLWYSYFHIANLQDYI